MVGDENFCTTESLCSVNEGDCDTHNECMDDFYCGSKNCQDSLGFGPEVDFCYEAILGDEHFC